MWIDSRTFDMHVFTYGSLMFAEVWSTVVAGTYRSAPAVARGYARYALRGETYPGAIAQADAALPGVVYFDVDAIDLAHLDRFEGDEYRRITVTVELADGSSVPAAMYLYLPVARLSADPWDPDGFEMDRFFATYCKDFSR